MAALSVRKGFAQTMRLIWIDARVEAAGFVRRADICAAFRISVPQASADLKAFRTRHPGSLAYDLNEKLYRRAGDAGPAYCTAARASVMDAAHLVGRHV